MKNKLITLIALAVLIAGMMSLAGCGEKAEEEAKLSGKVKIACLNGPTGMGLVDLMDNEDYGIKVYQAPTDVLPAIIKGDVDFACVPSNLAAVLYNKTKGKVTCVSPMVKGVLHILGNGVEAESLKDLKGKTIVASGQGGTPEYALQVVLEANGLKMGKDVKVEWLANHADVAAKLMKNKGAVAMLPEPFVSTVLTKGKDKVADLFDMNELWSDATSQDFPMGVLIARTEFVTERAEDLKIVLSDIKASIDDVNTASDEVAQKIVDNGFLADPEIAKKAIPNCSLCLYSDEDGGNSLAAGADIMKTFNETMFKASPKSVGGKLPGEDLYLTAYPVVEK